jgi:hypothetical protein
MEEIAADLQKMDSSTTVGGGSSVFILIKIFTKQKLISTNTQFSSFLRLARLPFLLNLAILKSEKHTIFGEIL